jgi:Flp pilus assembly protein TadD
MGRSLLVVGIVAALSSFAWAAPPTRSGNGKAAAPAGKPAARPDAAAQADRLAELKKKLEAHYQEGQFAEAESVLVEILRLNPRDAQSWYNLGCVQARQGRNDDAMVSLLRAVREGFGEADHAQRDDDLKPLREDPAFKRLIDRMRQAASSTRTRTTSANRYDEQERARRVAAINQKLAGAFKNKQFSAAEAMLRDILKIDPNNSTAHYNLACVHSRLGEKEEAVQWLMKAADLGYVGFRHMERDEDLVAIRQTPGYRDLLGKRQEYQKKRAEKIYAKLRDEFGEGYLYGIDHDMKLVFATDVDRQTLEDLRRRLSAYAAAQWRDLFTHQFDEYLTVVVPKEWRWGPAIGGFYNRENTILYARSVGMVLIHEFTHAMHFADQDGRGQAHPIWVTEGLATLFESSEMENGAAVPEHNNRLNMLQNFVRSRQHVKFEEFVRMSHPQFMQKAMYAYPEGRYMFMYLYEKGLLRKWYDAYVEGFAKDETGANAFEKVFGKDLDLVEKDWEDWVVKLKPPAMGAVRGQPYLGIQLRAAVDGVAIAGLVPGSGADKAGLRAGDVIVKIDDERVVDPGELTAAIRKHKVGDKVKVHYRRDGKYGDAVVLLAAMPGNPASSPASQPRRVAPARKPVPATRKAA